MPISNKEQTIYWEGQRQRRHPADPIMVAFVKPKLDFALQYIKTPAHPISILDVGYGNRLAEQTGLHILACETMGFVTSNRMSRFVVDLVNHFNGPNPFGAYVVLMERCD